MEFPYTVESQADFDALVKDRLARQAAKFADYDDVKNRLAEAESAAVEHAKALTAAEKSAGEAEARAVAAEAWKADREAAEALAKVRAEVAKSSGVPAEVLRGSSKEELEAHAEALKPLLPTAPKGPVIPNQGETPNRSAVAGSDEREAVKALFGPGDGTTT